MFVLGALTIGLLSSFHCMGMCGPIALALPLNRESNFSIFKGNLAYSVGRIATYLLLGGIVGGFGYGFVLAGLQQKLSILLGALMILFAFIGYSRIENGISRKLSFTFGQLKNQLSKRFQSKSVANLFIIGLLNGLLPCGMVYLAILGALALANPLNSILFMLGFAIGTLPLMWTIGFYGNKINYSFGRNLKKVIPYAVVALGLLFILRGMNLGIPYLSPELTTNTNYINCY